MTIQRVFEILMYPLGWPLALIASWYSFHTFQSGSFRTRSGRILSRQVAPIRFWTEVVGAALIAGALAVTGTIYLTRLI